MAEQTVATLKAVLKADTRNFNKGMKGVDKTLKKTDKGFGDLGKTLKGFGIALGGAAALGAIRSVVNAASDLEESINAVEVVFGDAAKEILAFTSDTEDAVFATASSLNELATVTGSLLQNFGFNARDAAKETINLTERAADMASVFNVEVGDALQSINAAVRGETESIRRFGVNVDEAAVKAKALELGLLDVGDAMTQEAKVAARVAIIMEQTAKVQGDAAATAGSFANQQRQLNEQLEVAKVEIGEKLMPVMQDLLKLAIDLAPEIGAIATSVAGLVAMAGQAIKIVIDISPLKQEDTALLAVLGLAGLKFGAKKVIPIAIAIELFDAFKNLNAVEEQLREFEESLLRTSERVARGGRGARISIQFEDQNAEAAEVAKVIVTNIEGALAQQELRMSLKGITIPEGPAEKAGKDLAGVFGNAFGEAFKKGKTIEQALADAVLAVTQQQRIQSLISVLGAKVPVWFLESVVSGVEPGAAIGILESFLLNPGPLLQAFGQTGIDSGNAAIAAMSARSDAMVATWAAIQRATALAGNAAFEAVGGPIIQPPGTPSRNFTPPRVGGDGRGGILMHSGGIVPGPPGANVPTVLQAGERVIPAGRSGGTTINVSVAGSVIAAQDLGEELRQILRTDTIRGGSMEFS